MLPKCSGCYKPTDPDKSYKIEAFGQAPHYVYLSIVKTAPTFQPPLGSMVVYGHERCVKRCAGRIAKEKGAKLARKVRSDKGIPRYPRRTGTSKYGI